MVTTLNFYDELIILVFFISSVIWMGLTLYSSLISQEFLMKASEQEKKVYLLNIQTNVMWYMRWSSLVSFLTSVYLMSYISSIEYAYNIGTSLASLMITFMFLNTWAIIWRKQKRIIALTRDADKCEQRYDLAIRTNSLLSLPLLGLMLYTAQTKEVLMPLLNEDGNLGPGWSSYSLWISILILIIIQINLVFGKNRWWMDTAKKLFITSILLTFLFGWLLRNS